jgi:tripartite-type tricarboxylate transporter receptor subunit TctC
VYIVVPFLAGGDTDTFARLFAPFLAEEFGWPVNIINMDGAAGNLGARYVLEAAPDGYTILFYHTGNLFTNLMNAVPGAVRHGQFELAAVAVHCEENVMVACASLGFADARGFLEYARRNPHGLRIAITDSTFADIILGLAEDVMGFSTAAVNVGGARLKAGSVLGGHAELAYNSVVMFLDYIEEGSLVPLWVASSTRNPQLPHVPTLAELGYAEAILGRSYFYAFPPGTDAEAVEIMSAAVAAAARNPELLRGLAEMGAAPPLFVPYYEMGSYMAAALSAFMTAMP